MIFRIGIFLNLLNCFFLLLIGENIVNYIIIFAIINAIANLFYYYPEQLLINRINSEDSVSNYISNDNLLSYLINVIFPIIFGYTIVKNSYDLVFIILIIIMTISLITSLFIKNINVKNKEINLKRFLKNNDKKLIHILSLRDLVGTFATTGALSILITVLTYIITKSEFSLGNISGLITLISILVVFIVKKSSNKPKFYKIFVPMSILQCLTTLLLMFAIVKLNINLEINIIANITVTLGLILVLIFNIAQAIVLPVVQ